MCLSCNTRVRGCDLFGAPIGVTYKSEYDFKTAVGGWASIILIAFMGSNLIMSILGVLIAPSYSSQTMYDYTPYSDHNHVLTMYTTNQTLIGGIEMDYGSFFKLPAGHIPDDYFRVQFYTIKMVDSVQSTVWHDAVRCNEKYADLVENG